MSRRGLCLDDSKTQSFFGSKEKKHRTPERICKTRHNFPTGIFDHIEGSTTEVPATVAWASSASIRWNAPQFETRICLTSRRKSKFTFFGALY